MSRGRGFEKTDTFYTLSPPKYPSLTQASMLIWKIARNESSQCDKLKSSALFENVNGSQSYSSKELTMS